MLTKEEIVRLLSGAPKVEALSRALRRAGAGAAYLVGGAVRDAALGGAENPDLDVALPPFPPSLPRAVAGEFGGTAFLLDAATSAWRVALPDGGTIDLVAYRGPGLEEDLAGRDFTVNAIAFDLLGGAGMKDPLDGLGDLAKKRLRLCGPQSIGDDPLRALRAYRFLACREFFPGPELSPQLREGALRMGSVSVERVRDEWFRLLDGPRAGDALRRMDRDGVLGVLFPFVESWRGLDQGDYHAHDLLEHTLRCVEAVERCAEGCEGLPEPERLSAHLAERHEASVTRRALLKWTAFVHDIGKPAAASWEGTRRRFIGHDTAGARQAAEVLAGLRAGNRTIRAAERLVAGHMRLFGLAHQEKPTRRARLRYLRDFGRETPEAVLLALADETATGPEAPAREALLAAGREILELFWNPEIEAPPLLLGRDLIGELGMEEGPEIGRVLAAVALAEAEGRVETREEALQYARGLTGYPAGQKK